MHVSVIIPTKDRPFLLTKCLESLTHQTVKPFKIIIVDNSKKSSAELVSKQFAHTHHNLLYLKERRTGSSFARNKGLLYTTGTDIVAFIDDDCIADKNWVKNICIAFTHPHVMVVQGKSLIRQKNNLFELAEYIQCETNIRAAWYKDKTGTCTHALDSKNLAIRTKILPKNQLRSLFDTKLPEQYDTDLTIRLLGKKITLHVNKNMIVYHYGRSTLITHLKRVFALGWGYYQFKSKWQTDFNETNVLIPFLQQSKKGQAVLYKKTMRKRIIYRMLLRNLNISSKRVTTLLALQIIGVIDWIVFQSGYFISNIYQQMVMKKYL